jgi:hypothetical protein
VGHKLFQAPAAGYRNPASSHFEDITSLESMNSSRRLPYGSPREIIPNHTSRSTVSTLSTFEASASTDDEEPPSASQARNFPHAAFNFEPAILDWAGTLTPWYDLPQHPVSEFPPLVQYANMEFQSSELARNRDEPVGLGILFLLSALSTTSSHVDNFSK